MLHSTGTLRSGESEHHALVQWRAAPSGLQSLMVVWRVTVKVQLATDQHRCTWRRSKGRHIVTRYLWQQERVSRRELHIHKVSTADDRGEAPSPRRTKKVTTEIHKMGTAVRVGRAQKRQTHLFTVHAMVRTTVILRALRENTADDT